MGVAIDIPLLRRRRRRSGPAQGRNRARKLGQGKAAPQSARHSARQSSASGASRKRQPQPHAPGRLAWLNRILILLGVGAVSVVGLKAWIYLSTLPVERITVTGELAYTRTSAVQDMVQPALVGGFLGADLAQVRDQLQALPWIYQANVRRVWPNALVINVVEQLPIARWGESGFLNHEGEVFRPSNRQDWVGLPQLRGPDGAAGDLMHTYQRLVDILAPLGLSVSELAVDGRGQVEAVLSGGQTLVIGGNDFRERMQRFSRLYRLELASRMNEVERVDLRYEKGVAVAYRAIPAQEPKLEQEKA